MTIATVKYISNGYMVNGQGIGGQAPESVYALTIVEVVYWIGRMFDPIVQAAPPPARSVPAPRVIEPDDDPLLGQLANVQTVASGGFLVTQLPGLAGGGRPVDVYCVDMDAVSATLTQIYTPPPADEPVPDGT